MSATEQEWEAGIALLVQELEGEVGDVHEIYQRLKQSLATMRAEGLPIPADLQELEAGLDARFTGEGAGEEV